MKILTPGHLYQLDHHEAKGLGSLTQTIQFIEKVPAEPGSKDLLTVHDGTTNEEVLRMLIDRMNYLQGKFPCRENALVITKLEESLMWLEKRTADRQARGVAFDEIRHAQTEQKDTAAAITEFFAGRIKS